MNRRIFIVIASLCIIIFLLVLVFFILPKDTFPSVVDSSCKVASNIDVTVDMQVSGDEQQLVCNVENHNTYEVTYGEEYYVEIEKDGKWYEVIDRSGKRTNEKAWNALLNEVPANGQNEFIIDLKNYMSLSDGNYRVVKYINLPEKDTSISYIIVAPFQVRKK